MLSIYWIGKDIEGALLHPGLHAIRHLKNDHHELEDAEFNHSFTPSERRDDLLGSKNYIPSYTMVKEPTKRRKDI
jgi:hypothetical protein